MRVIPSLPIEVADIIISVEVIDKSGHIVKVSGRASVLLTPNDKSKDVKILFDRSISIDESVKPNFKFQIAPAEIDQQKFHDMMFKRIKFDEAKPKGRLEFTEQEDLAIADEEDEGIARLRDSYNQDTVQPLEDSLNNTENENNVNNDKDTKP